MDAPMIFTHLLVASWLGQVRIVEQLLDEGADINSRSKKYGTALNIAAARKDKDMTRMLLDRNARARLGGKEYSVLHMKRVSELGMGYGVALATNSGLIRECRVSLRLCLRSFEKLLVNGINHCSGTRQLLTSGSPSVAVASK